MASLANVYVISYINLNDIIIVKSILYNLKVMYIHASICIVSL